MARTSAELTLEEIMVIEDISSVDNDKFLYKDSNGDVIWVDSVWWASWWTITGTLSDQTDLKSALDNRQQNIQFQDEWSDTGTSWWVNIVDFIGGWVSVAEVLGKLTVTVSGGGDTTNNYSSILAPQLFNPDAWEVTAGTADFTLSSANSVAFVTLNGQTLDDVEYTLAASVLTVAPANWYDATSDEVLVFQHSFTTTWSAFVRNLTNENADYIMTHLDYCVNATANSFNMTLPTAVWVWGQAFYMKNSWTGIITIKTTSSQTIDGQASWVITLAQYEWIQTTSDGSNRIITES